MADTDEGKKRDTNIDVKCVLIRYEQCRGKLLLKVMHYNIALLSKKVTDYVTFYGK